MAVGTPRNALRALAALLVWCVVAVAAPAGVSAQDGDGSEEIDVNALYQQANALVPRGRFDEALELYGQVVAAQPSWSDPWFNMGEVCRVAERPACCVRNFRRYLYNEGGSAAFDYDEVSGLIAGCAEALAGAGSIEVRATPAEARIAIDGLELASGVLEPLPVAPGSYLVTVSLEDHNEHAETVEVGAGQAQTIAVALNADELFGGLIVSTHVEGLQILVDDAPVGTTPQAGALPVPVGEHLVRLTHPDYHDWVRRIEVIRDEDYFLEPEMQRTEESFRDDVP